MIFGKDLSLPGAPRPSHGDTPSGPGVPCAPFFPGGASACGSWRDHLSVTFLTDHDDWSARMCSFMGVAGARRNRGVSCCGGCRVLGLVADRAWGDTDDPLERTAEGRF